MLRSRMTSPKPCPDLRCSDPENRLPVSDRDQVEMVVEVGLVAAMLDNEIPAGESKALVTAIRLLPGLRDLGDDQVNALLVRAAARTRRGDDWLREVACGLTDRGLRRVAFRLAALFCAWDGVIDDKEQGYLNWLARVFDLDDDEAMRLFAEATAAHPLAAGKAGAVEPAPG
jgi:tellurite resistance protein